MNGRIVEPIKRKTKMPRVYKRARKLGGKIRRHNGGKREQAKG